MELYTQQDLQANQAQMRGVLWRTGILSALCVAGIVASLIIRSEWLTVGITIVWGALLIFLWDIKFAPVYRYRRYLRELLGGLRHRTEGAVVSLAQEGTYKEGVFFSALLINVDPKMDPEGERLFYVDRCKPRPELAPGDRISLEYHGNYVTAWAKQ